MSKGNMKKSAAKVCRDNFFMQSIRHTYIRHSYSNYHEFLQCLEFRTYALTKRTIKSAFDSLVLNSAHFFERLVIYE